MRWLDGITDSWTWCVCAQSCVSLCDSLNYSTPDSSDHGISQARILECVAILFQGIFLTQGLNLCCLHLLHYRLILYPLSHLGMLFSDQLCPILCDPMVCPWNSLGKNTGVGCHSLLQGIFLTQESNPGLLHCRQILYQLCYERSLLCERFANQFAPKHLSKLLSFPHYVFLAPMSKFQLIINAWIYFWAIYSVPLVCVSIFMPVPCCFD